MKQFGIQIKTGTEGIGKVLTCDANGVGNWTTLSGITSGITSTPVLLGTIDFNEVNAGLAVGLFTTIFTGGKPANKFFPEAFAKVIVPFANYSNVAIKLASIRVSPDDSSLNITNKIVVDAFGTKASSRVQDVSVTLQFDNGLTANPRNYTQGKIEIYVVLKDITL